MTSITKRFSVSVSTVSARNAWHNAFLLCPKFDQKIGRGGASKKMEGGGFGTFPETLTLFQTKICDFPYPISDLKPWSPTHDQSVWQAVMTHTRLEMILSPNDEEVASSKKHSPFKTRVHKPYPISDQKGHNWYPISDQHGWKTIPFHAAHTYIAFIREYPPPPGRKTCCRLWVLLLMQARLIISTC